MKLFLPFFTSLLFITVGFGQECDHIILTSQAEVDNFHSLTLNCIEIASLTIQGEDISNLDSLIYLESITRSLSIEETSLIDFEGISHLDFRDATDYRIIDNNALVSIFSLQLDGEIDSMIILGNQNLQSFFNQGFIDYANYIQINRNESLVEIPFFESLRAADEVHIFDNVNLEECCGLFEMIDRAEIGSLRLDNNGESCSSTQTIREQCGYCFDHNIFLRSQDEVDNFRINYPACTEINSLRIEGEEIVNLDSLYYLKSIDPHDLTIENTSLTNLDGISHIIIDVDHIEILDNLLLESINLSDASSRIDFRIINNPSLLRIEILPGFDHSDFIEISGNSSLLNLDGISNFGSVGDIEISGNSSLTNIDGLSGIDVRHDVRITDNINLVSITGLASALDHRLDRLVIHGNSSLSDCCILEEYFTYEHPHEDIDFEISANAEGCISIDEIESMCDPMECGTSNIVLTSQAEVNDFQINFPNCQSINSIKIEGSDISNLNGLSNIFEVTNRLEIVNTSLLNLTGLEGLRIGFNADIWITDNPNLEYLGTLLFESEIDSMIISNNLGLDATGYFDGLSNLEYLEITNNPILSDITAIESLEWATIIKIEFNQNLNECCPLYYLFEGGLTELILSNNGTSCNSEITIREQCGFCEDHNVFLRSQEEVDNFKNNHSACLEIHSLHIHGEDITNLDSLYVIESLVGNDLFIENTSLRNLDAIEGLLVDVVHLEIINNPQLEEVNFQNLESNPSVLHILDNHSLVNIDGLSSIEYADVIVIAGNSSLQNLNGLVNTRGATALHIGDNSSLTDISGIVNTIEGLANLTVHGNSSLSDCCILEQLLYQDFITYEISANAPGCEDDQNIISNCSGEICEINQLILTTQAEIDAFPSQYPNCQTINWLTIEGEDITNLDSLYQLRRINGSIQIINTSIEYIEGLMQVEHAEDIFIENNSLLKTVRGLENIQFLPETLTIRNNDALQDLSGVNFLESIGAVILDDNDLLTQIDDFSNLQSVILFSITENDVLSDCCIVDHLLSLGVTPSNIIIENNAERCTSYEDARTSCNIGEPCEFEDVTFSNQEEVDAFHVNYPNCTEIRHIYIEGEDIVSLENLSSIDRIYGDVSIQSTSLVSLLGLNIDREIYAIHISNNQLLEDLSPLNNVGATEARIIISNNQSLIHLDDLSNLTYTGDAISIHNNASLASIDGLSNLSSLERFYAVDNPSLNECCFINTKINEGVNTEGITITGNADGCSNVENIISSCDGEEGNEGAGGDGRDVCQSNRIRLRSQLDVDNFVTDYADCNVVSELIIQGLDIENLNGLSGLTAITDILKIDETSLVDFSGFTNVDLSTLQELTIIDNQILDGLFGLTIPAQMDRVVVADNPLLLNIENLEPLRTYEYLEIFRNSNLSSCCPIVSALDHKDGRMVVRSNREGCNELSQIVMKCDANQTVDCTEITLFSQQDIDNFTLDYPGCTTTNILHLDGIDIENLDGIATLTEVTREIYVGSTQLTDLSGLQNITFDNLEIVNFYDNNQLENLLGFNLRGHVMEMNIDEHDSLADLSGLEELQSANHFGVSFNNSLIALTGLEGLSSTEHLLVTENPELINVDALANITDITYGDIFQNVSLSDCCVLLPMLNVENSGVSIGDNATGCNYLDEVETSCEVTETEIVECTNEIIVLSSQQEVDDFATDFAGCNSVNALEIKGVDITNLDGLNHLAEVRSYISISRTSLENLDVFADVNFSTGEYLIVKSNQALTSIAGLNTAHDMKHIKITDNGNLRSLSGLDNLVHSDYMAVENNNSLTDLSGLNNLIRIDRFTVSNNESLISLDGLQMLQSVQTLSVYFNPALESLDALSRLISFDLMHFNFNSLLTECCGLKLAIENQEDDDYLIVRDNAEGCRSVDEIIETCTDNGFVEGSSSSSFIEATGTFSDKEFKVYPNPFTNNLIIKKPREVSSATISLHDIQGTLIINQKIDSAEKSINTALLHAGIYLVKIEASNNVQTFKMIKN